MSKVQHVYWTVFLNALPGMTPIRFQALVKTFGSTEESFKVGPSGWRGIEGFTDSCLKTMLEDWEGTKDVARYDMNLIEKGFVEASLWTSSTYPDRLKEISTAPPIIYKRGKANDFNRPAIAFVGSRRCSLYGQRSVRDLVQGCVESGIVVVSGLARGIDKVAHETALNNQGETWAVLGSGLENIYPPEHKKLAQQIEAKGCLFSEFPLGRPPLKQNFPQRNRIVSGLCLATVVVEGTDKSGALITARLAAEQGREVMAVPGPIHSSLSQAPHYLLKSGARLVETVADILDELHIPYAISEQQKDQQQEITNSHLDLNCRSLLEVLGDQALSRDALAHKLNRSPGDLSVDILTMQLKGYIESLPGDLVCRKI